MFDEDLLTNVLLAIFRNPQNVKADFARSHANVIACLACEGFISTHEGQHRYGTKWRITGTGLDKLRGLGVL